MENKAKSKNLQVLGAKANSRDCNDSEKGLPIMKGRGKGVTFNPLLDSRMMPILN